MRQVPQAQCLPKNSGRRLVFICAFRGETVCQTAGIQMGSGIGQGLLCGYRTSITTGMRVIYDRRIRQKRTTRLKEDIVRFGLDGVLEAWKAATFSRGESGCRC